MASSAATAEESSPLRTKHYMKTLGGESASRSGSATGQNEDPGRGNPAAKTLDFTQAELPFTNFASVQETREKERMDPAGTTIASDNTKPGAPSISDYYSLAKRQGHRQDVQFSSL